MFYGDPATDVTVAPYFRTVGQEAEFSSGDRLAELLKERRLSPQTRAVHGAHCKCSDANDYPIHSVEDSSARGGEYHIGGNRGVLFGSPTYATATHLLAEAATEVGCGLGTTVGFHTHVGLADARTGVEITKPQKIELLRAYLCFEDEIHSLAAGPESKPRNNPHVQANFPQSSYLGARFWSTPAESLAESFRWPGKSTCLNLVSHHGTIEFRVWNATKAQWRMHLAAGISTALVEAAAQGRTVSVDNPGTLVGFLDGLLTVDLVMLVRRQLNKNNN